VKGVVLVDVMKKIVCAFLSIFCFILVVNGDKTPLFIQGFVPRDNPTFVATSIEPAAHLAIDDINNSPTILANYTLNLTFVDTKVSNV